MVFQISFQIVIIAGIWVLQSQGFWPSKQHNSNMWQRPQRIPPEFRTFPKTIGRQKDHMHLGGPSVLKRRPIGNSHWSPFAKTGIRHPSQKSPGRASNNPPSSMWDPLGFLSPREDRPKGPLKRLGDAYARPPPPPPATTTTTTEAPPPMVYFPEGGSGACEDFNPSGFNTYSFMSFLFSVANLVGLVANNVNNNLNNNNNNNNNDNNNLNNINAANSNSAQNNDNTVMIPAAMGRRRRRGRNADEKHDISSTPEGAKDVTALVAIDFIRGMRNALLAGDDACALRNFCETNFRASSRGKVAEIVAEVFSAALVDLYPKKLPVSQSALLSAGQKGRQNTTDCTLNFPSCTEAKWHQINDDFDFDHLLLEMHPEELMKELKLTSVEGFLLKNMPSHANVDAWGSSFPQ